MYLRKLRPNYFPRCFSTRTGKQDLAKTSSNGSPKPSNQSPVIRGGIRCTRVNAYLGPFDAPRLIVSRTSLSTKSGMTKRLSLLLLIRVNNQVIGKVATLHSNPGSTIRQGLVLLQPVHILEGIGNVNGTVLAANATHNSVSQSASVASTERI